ncbi:anthrax toxin-like adenylyl cyclase domain-containing protein [Bacillus paranthracis]|uniref:anthrax toxin-like adenylyl cyclase domain-containing protein n=1 Tax=Bacillus paranthracis TaxID=2026186 RepID=UPI001E2C3F1D|nr:anthrax toxin-like adenylyl cyclase domain-containing protein [Bacillus paranthracis]MCR6801161.1 hypothetical protein [Bacillus paranthracis]MEC3361138.1 anthrax toxin-like adenylyl cyclase domain-containing protein [Bacillus paranthracis]MED0787349.1 anthrax toxin-like adenylyl cyclase domain-containing protein [Bacillus paranthracis]MED0813319.1 anthrax toxin-like adenylyl cyclase domain-containing protein [Bacillus paranthracis]MED0818290.1 anthrax toxin-like adenylyl cyclase domain-con
MQNHKLAGSPKNLIQGEEAIQRSGLVPEHVAKFIKIASDHNMYLLFRPVNLLSTSLIKGGAATKGLNVHGKSADWGPQAGYIPFDADISKVHGILSKVLKGNADNQLSLEETDPQGNKIIGKVVLNINEERLIELQNKNIINLGEWDERGNRIIESPNKIYDFRWNKESNRVQYKTKEGEKTVLEEQFDWRYIEVMGKLKNQKVTPLTADYDMFAMAPSLSEIKKQIPADEWRELVEEASSPIEKWRNITRLLIKYGLMRESDPEKGKLAEWQREIIDILNNAAIQAGYTGGTVVNHGTEQDNTDYPEQDPNIFIITPEKEVLLTESWDETIWFVETVIVGNPDDTFLFYANRSYNVIAAGSHAQILWNEPIPTPREFENERMELERVIGRKLPEEYSEEISEISNLLHLFYYPANQFVYFNRTYQEVSLFRAIQIFGKLKQLIDNEIPIEEYQIYFEILYARTLNHIKVILRIEGIALTITTLIRIIQSEDYEIVAFYKYLESVHQVDIYSQWNPKDKYGFGQFVQYNKVLYSAREWTQGDEPGKSRFWKLDTDYMIPWNQYMVFEYNNETIHKNRVYRAKEWTQDDEPGISLDMKWKLIYDR